MSEYVIVEIFCQTLFNGLGKSCSISRKNFFNENGQQKPVAGPLPKYQHQLKRRMMANE